MKDVISEQQLCGRVAFGYGDQFCSPTKNAIASSWNEFLAPILLGKLFSAPIEINGVYIEFENDGGQVVTPPTFERDDDHLLYYQQLTTTTGNRDYLRLPITGRSANSLKTAFSIIAETTGVAGQNGLPFSSSQQSRVYGGSVVYRRSDLPSEDVVFSRAYISDSDKQLVKLAGRQISLRWEFTVN